MLQATGSGQHLMHLWRVDRHSEAAGFCQTQQAGQPAAAVARHQHCSGGCYTEGGVEDHAPRLWEGREGAVPG